MLNLSALTSSFFQCMSFNGVEPHRTHVKLRTCSNHCLIEGRTKLTGNSCALSFKSAYNLFHANTYDNINFTSSVLVETFCAVMMHQAFFLLKVVWFALMMQ